MAAGTTAVVGGAYGFKDGIGRLDDGIRKAFSDAGSNQRSGASWPVRDDVAGPAGGKTLRPPNARHTVAGAKSGEVKAENSVILRGQGGEINDDIAQIADGRATFDGATNNYGINGRLYRVEPSGTVYPVSGPGIVQLDRNEYAALQGIAKSGGDMDRFASSFGRNPRFTPQIVQKALAVYEGRY
ncbi:hypothetical protein GXW82_42905 [Streptacidiphilus sp. 4-A2]|nr:hypothetical protein [Streptacidiphilus sp. 4-A2]